jgi:carbon monoxide dehydrogenase subunit G
MHRIESRTGTTPYPTETVFNFMADFRNFKELVKSKLPDFEATENNCTFTIPSLGKGEMFILDKEPFKTLKMQGKGINNSRFTLWVQTKEANNKKTHVKITMEPELNPMLLAIAKSHLHKFVDMLIDHIEDHPFDAMSCKK